MGPVGAWSTPGEKRATCGKHMKLADRTAWDLGGGNRRRYGALTDCYERACIDFVLLAAEFSRRSQRIVTVSRLGVGA